MAWFGVVGFEDEKQEQLPAFTTDPISEHRSH